MGCGVQRWCTKFDAVPDAGKTTPMRAYARFGCRPLTTAHALTGTPEQPVPSAATQCRRCRSGKTNQSHLVSR
jgi:hypothetical protein